MNLESSILEEYIAESSKLYFIFGGICSGISMPPFEFYNSSRIINENKIFFRDFSQSWYQNGLPNVGADVFEISEFIQQKIYVMKPKEIYFVGNSMGGYAAILFASLVKQGTAIAFAPQSFISPLQRLKILEKRWSKQILKMYAQTFFKKHVWDLRKHLEDGVGKAKINIFVPKRNKLDYFHANRLRGLKSVSIFEFEAEGHALVRDLRDNGSLADILSGQYM